MCGRYQLGKDEQPPELAEIIESLNRRPGAEDVKTRGEVFPTDRVPVVATGKSLRPGVFAMTWGYAAPDGRRVINARSETAGERPMFRDGMAARRCAVPAVNYYEWTHSGRDRRKYAIRPEGEALTWLAGVYRLADGGPEFAILTREPAPDIAFIHNRMPVILPEALVKAWISPGADAQALLGQAVQALRFQPADGENAQLAMDFAPLEGQGGRL